MTTSSTTTGAYWQDGAALLLTDGQDYSPLIEIDVGGGLCAVAFSMNSKYLVSGDFTGVRVWRMEDGKQMATMATPAIVQCLAVSKDGRWIAAGTASGEVFVWNAKTYEEVFLHEEDDNIYGVDFSPDSNRLVIASDNCTATVLDLITCGRVLGPLDHEDWVHTAKYSPQGDRIATATRDNVRVYDSNNGRLLVDIKVDEISVYNAGLLWSNDQLFIVSDSKIKQVEVSTGSTVSEWPVSDADAPSCIILPQRGQFIAHSTGRTVTLWDAMTHTQLGLIHHTQDICTIALSPDHRFLAIGGVDEKIIINSLPRITVSIV